MATNKKPAQGKSGEKKLVLYEVSAELRDLILSDEHSDDMIERIGELTMAFENKAVSINHVLGELDSFVDMAKAEEKRIAQKRKVIENRAASLKEYLKSCMEASDIMKLEVGTLTFSLQKNPASVIIDDKDAVPAKYKTVEQVVTIDKAAIKRDISDDNPIDGCRSESSGLSLRIR